MGSSAGSVVTGLNPTEVNKSNPFPLFVIHAVVIIGLCYVLHLFLRKLKQLRVISEVIAGILLGPSVMGRIPAFATTIFHPDSLPFLNLVSNIGLLFFLFLVGLELDPALVVKRAKFALGISFAGMVLPLGEGAAVSYVLYEELGPDTNVGFGQFLLFCGVAMAITAFPVLARILAEQKLLTTKVGFLTICAGAVGDIVAWILLALVVSIINSASKITPLYVVLLSIAWILILVFAIRPLFSFMIRRTKSQDEPSQTMMAFTMAVVLVSAFVTDIIGVHAIFGSFLVGLIIPNDTGFADGVTKRIEDLVSVIFLPIYFALSGLKLRLACWITAKLGGLVILVTFVACFGKIVGCTSAARIQGMEWRESLAIGVLMNCKGLVELVVLNIGYDAGVINARVFVIMVAMCLITTGMTTPLVSWIYPPHYQRDSALRSLAKEKGLTGDIERAEANTNAGRTNKGIMLCLDKIQNLPAMMTFLRMLHFNAPEPQATETGHLAVPSFMDPRNTPAATEGPSLIALRLLHLTERSSSVLMAATERAEVLRRDTLMVVFQAFAKLNGISVQSRMTLSVDPDDFAQSIYDEAVESGADTIIFPWNSTSLPDPPSSAQTALFIDREFGGAGHFANVMVPLYGFIDDEEAVKLASTMSRNHLCNVILVRIKSVSPKSAVGSPDEIRLEVKGDHHSIDSEAAGEEVAKLPQDDEALLLEYFPHRVFANGNKRHSLNGKKSSTDAGTEIGQSVFMNEEPSIQDAIGLSKALLGPRDLLVLGRGPAAMMSGWYSGGLGHAAEPSGGATGHGYGAHSGAATTMHQIDHPLSGPTSGEGSRSRHLRSQPSSRDIHHSTLTVASVLGLAAQSYLSNEVPSCLLVVQSGKKHRTVLVSFCREWRPMLGVHLPSMEEWPADDLRARSKDEETLVEREVDNMPVPGQTLPMPAEFSAFTFPPPPTRPGHIVLNRFFLYETKTRFFIVGTNAPAGTRFRVLKIDRTTAPDELSITEDEAVYTKSEVDDLLEMIANGNKSTGGMREIAKFYGIVGFVRFTEGYYLTIITKRSSVALIGGHYIFHIDATSTVSIHSSTTPTSKLDKNSDEARYLQMYQMVDLTKNFYFSYSYDITRTLQANMTRLRTFPSTPVKSSPAMSSSTSPSARSYPSSSSTTAAATVSTEVDAEANGETDLDASVLESGRNKMFVWNQYLLENGFGEHLAIDNQWALPIMYGFVDQSKLSILGRNVFVTLIARRSRLFAGARFLKRGVNDRGYVANDVETEQIVSEMSTTSFYGAGTLDANPNHTSFVQHRGSIPLFWTQDGTNMSPKPPIELNVVDPYFTAAALHFDDMFKRYGAPCIVLNLIKAKEKTARESILLKEFTECIDYLNQFLPEDKKIQHIKWDMSRASKSPNENVISVLEIIAEKTFAQTGFFHSGYNQQHLLVKGDQSGNDICGSRLQNGVVRTNCIDCLDRTNAAQFIIAKCALGHQLFSLGLIAEPIVPFDCDVVNMLTEMYHDHGDTIALQYGGSHLVNTMETYRKINQWTSHSRDMLESIRRFYSNSFVDAEKQDAMNLFLGNYVVHKGQPALWELPGDYHLHNITDPELKKIRKSYTKWFTPDAILPQADLIRKRLQEYEELELRQFSLHDAGYDEYEGVGRYGNGDGDSDDSDDSDDEGGTFSEGIPQHKTNDHDSGTMRSSDQHDPSLRHVDRKVVGDHIEHLRSDDEDEYGSTGHPIPFAKSGRVQSIDSIQSARSSASLSEQGRRKSSIVSSSVQSSMNSIHTHRTQTSNTSPLPGGDAPSPQTKEAIAEVESTKSGPTSSVDESLLDFKDRIVTPLNPVPNSESQEARKPSLVPASSWDICESAEGDAGKSTSWDEYWDDVKKSAEQSPFEVRQNQGMLSQAELNAKAAAKSERPSMLSWLGLMGDNSNPANDKGRNGSSSTKSGASPAGYANGSKTLPLSTGRKKGFLSSLADPVHDSNNPRQHKDGVAHHIRSSRLSVASFPVTSSAASTIAELDEKASVSGSSFTTNRTVVPGEKVRLPPHIPRSKGEEFELTKNVSTNIAKFEIHDSAFVPSVLSPEQPQAPAERGKKDTGDSTTASGGHGEVTTKGRSGIEDLVKKSLAPEVTSQESKEYK
ncbi:phosphatidylinositol-3,5-bisphosphate 5-phosphatase, partial [Podila clonocystis]